MKHRAWREFSRAVAVSVAVAAFGAAMSTATSGTAHAQVDPRGDMRTIATAHLRVHMRADQESVGRRAASIAEAAYAQLSRELAPPSGVIDLLLADNVDYSNGFAQTFPTNRVVVYAVPPVAAPELRFHDDWLRLVITHELAHIFHLDRATGLWRVGRTLLGRNPIFFPNAYTPSWLKEGLAVHYESLLTGSGRVISTESGTIARSAARDGEIPDLNRWSLATTRFPLGQTAYAYGTLLMDRAARVGGDSSMRRFVEAVGRFPVPFLLDRASRRSFGQSFSQQFDAMRDSLQRLARALDTTGDASWRVISNAGWRAHAPRWWSRDSLIWTASNGRDVTGLYVADIGTDGNRAVRGARRIAKRIARRNGLDVNAPVHGDAGVIGTVFAQNDYRNPYEVRSDLYRGFGDREERLTDGARLAQPDVRRDGGVVALQLGAAGARLVRVQLAEPGVAPSPVRITPIASANIWADPRWSPDGSRLVAVEFLPTGEERVVVMDADGMPQQIVAGSRAVFASPSFTPDGRRLVWSSDRSGRMQLETAPVAPASAAIDTSLWRTERADVRVASRVSTGVYQPSVSPDGRQVAALLQRVNGFEVVVAPLDTTGPMARNTWYPQQNTTGGAAVPTISDASSSYRAARQLLPSYWLPQIGTGREGRSTYGLSTSAVDILERHEWSATALIEPRRGEVDASAAYRYRGLGIPYVDVSVSQEWNGTFGIVDSLRRPLGTIARRRRFATVAATWWRPRVRTSISAAFGAQYELRDFTADVDSLLGSPTSLLRSGTRYPSLFLNTSYSTAQRGGRGISVEEGITLSTSTSYRWRQDNPRLGTWRESAALRGYLPLDLPGFSRHVLMARVAGGTTGDNAQTEFEVGGVSGIASALLPGVVIGDPSRTFPVRGVAPGIQRGTRALGGTVEYRAPLVMLRHAPGPLTFFADRFGLTLFSDAARAWCPGSITRTSPLCLGPGVRDGWIASAGAELVMDFAVQYDAPFRLRLGAAAPYVAPTGVPRGGAVYVTLGSIF